MESNMVKHTLLVLVSLLVSMIQGNAQGLVEEVPLVTAAPIAVRQVLSSDEANWHPNGDWLVVVTEPNTSFGENSPEDNTAGNIEIWSPLNMRAESFDVPPQFQPQSEPYFAPLMTFSPDGLRLAALTPQSFTVFDVVTGLPVFRREGAPVYFLEWSPDGTRIAVQSRSDYYSLDVIDAMTGNILDTYRFFDTARVAPGAVLYDVSWGSSDEIAVIAADNHRAILNLQTNIITDISNCCVEGAYELDWQPNGRLLATHDRIYDLDTRQLMFSYPFQTRVSWSPDRQSLIGIVSTEVSLISIAEQAVILRFSTAVLGEDHAIIEVTWSPDGQYVALTTTSLIVTETDVAYRDYVSIWDIQQIMADAGYTPAQ